MSDQVKTHLRYVKPLLFFLSDFLSGARSVPFHIRKQIVPSVAGGLQLYEAALAQSLSDPVCRYFINRRNESEKEGYLPMEFTLLRCQTNDQGAPIRTEIAKVTTSGSRRK